MPLLLFVKLIATAVIWGGTFVAGRILAQQLGPYSAAFLRFVVASACLYCFVLRTHGKLPPLTKKQRAGLALGADRRFQLVVFLLRPADCHCIAPQIIATNPVFIALLAALFAALAPLRIVGIIPSQRCLHGDRQPSRPSFRAHGYGELMTERWPVVAYSRSESHHARSFPVAVTYSCAIGTLALLVPAVMEGVAERVTHISPSAWLSILYLGLMGSAVGFFWYYQGIKALGPARAGVFINIVPLSSVLLAFLLLHESVDASLLTGAVLIVGGVYLTNRAPSSKTV
jgi:drug/metabolite transporter (DMT)-like permease